MCSKIVEIMDEKKTSPVIIFDDECPLCRSAVKFMRTKNTSSGIRFVPSSDTSAIQLLDAHKISKETTDKTVILIDKDKSYIKSAAIIKTLMKKGYIWRIAVILFIVPSFIRDTVYDWFAQRRK